MRFICNKLLLFYLQKVKTVTKSFYLLKTNQLVNFLRCLRKIVILATVQHLTCAVAKPNNNFDWFGNNALNKKLVRESKKKHNLLT